MNAPNPLALTAAVLLTAFSVLAFDSNTNLPTVASVEPAAHITRLAPVTVTPSAEDLREAAVTADASAAATPAANAIESSASLIGAQLAMPYYSFGSSMASFSKE